MGKVMKSGKSFKGCVAYCMQKQLAEVVYADGIRTAQVAQAIADFNMQRKLNPNLGQAVGHIALAFSPNDVPLLSDEKMVGIALQYLQRMKIDNTQVLIVKHNDTQHPHLHIVYNRVSNNGKTISDSMLREKNVRITKALTIEHGLHFSHGKENVKRQSLKGADRVKYELFDVIKTVSKQAKSMDELKQILKRQGIEILYKYRNGTTEIQGISFAKDEYKFKGSEIDRSLSYAKLNASFLQRAEQAPSLADQIRQALSEKNKVTTPSIPSGKLHSHGPSMLETLLSTTAAGAQPTPDDSLQYRKKKKKQGQSHSIGR